MRLADLSIKRPVFVTSLVFVILVLGLMSISKLPVDLFPNITFPVVTVTTIYPGAGPAEVETLVSKIYEDEFSTVNGIKRLSSTNNEGVSTVIAEFTLETDIKYAEQQIRDRVTSAKRKLPDDVEEPIIRRIDPADQPILILSVTADLKEGELFDLADKELRPKIEQVPQVGLVEVIGGREREIHVALDRAKLKTYELSATGVNARIGAAGANIPAGKVDQAKSETVIRTLGEFKTVQDIGNVIVSFFGNDVPVTVNDVGQVIDTVKDENSRAYYNGEKSIYLLVFRQSGANTIAVADSVKARVLKIDAEMKSKVASAKVAVVRDGAKPIRANVDDVKEAILIGIILTIIVVYFFLGSGRSTFITGLALPNSLIGAFFLMWVCGFSINIMTLLALSLAVGLLIDDAIVVRENIFRHLEMGKSAIQAASEGTKEVTLAVIATTLAVVAVFGPIAFLQGVVGQFFKEFGLTICFAMLISLFDAMTMAPMLSAYFAGAKHGVKSGPRKGLFAPIGNAWEATMGRALKGFDRFQTRLEDRYERVLGWTVEHPMKVLVGAFLIFVVSLMSTKYIPKTFLPPQDTGEFSIALDMPPGTNLDQMTEVSKKVDETLRANKEIDQTIMFIGSSIGAANKATFFVNMVPSADRDINTSDFKAKIREQLKPYKEANPIVKDIDMVAGGQRAFNLNIIGNDMVELEKVALVVAEKLRSHPGLLDVDMTHRPGKPEFQVVPDKLRAERLGVATNMLGQELRTQVEGTIPAVFREGGEEYDIRVRLKEDQRDIQQAFAQSYVPNVNQSLIRLADVAQPIETTGPATITRQDRGRYIQIQADVAPNGPGMGGVMADIDTMFKTDVKLPEGMRYAFMGQAENFQELMTNMVMAAILGILFIYLVLASLYESFITPLTILLVLPLAAIGAFFALAITQESLNIFSMIGCIMLMGVATKNSILLVDYSNQLIGEGMSMRDAVIRAGKVRLRPILMTTFALIAGMLPLAIGLNEASKQRTAMGVAVVGGLISSTLLTLLVVPAAFSYFERFRRWSLARVKRAVGEEDAVLTNGHDKADKTVRRPEVNA